ncbi:MAG: hypothetical protein IK062_07935 [Selenomonadaceae bacterium]|nr:hypothetical protein [Selenomonadaceae bacterium]
MLYVNTRHQLPQISIHQTWSKLNKSSVVPAEVHGSNEQASSNKWITQPTTEIDNYPSRRAYGARKMTDLTREQGQKGISDAQSATSTRTQRAWGFIDDASKRGNYVARSYKNTMMSKYQSAKNLVNFSLMPAPNISVTQGQVVGESDLGDVTAEIENKSAFAEIEYTPGSAETQLADKGFIRTWTTEGHYDIYA